MTGSDTRLIWVTPRFPLGTPDGARHATRSLLQHLSRLKIGIDVICLLPAGDVGDATAAQEQLGLLSCSLIHRERTLFSRMPSLKTPFTFKSFSASAVRLAVRQRLQALMKTMKPSDKLFLIMDGLHPFACLSPTDLRELSGRCRGVIYRAHNVETTLWEQCGARSRTPWFRWFFQHQAALVGAFESRVSREAAMIAPVSEEDAGRFRSWAPEALISVTPIGMDFPEEGALQTISTTEILKLLFVGRLDWLPNRSGLQWFLQKVWPRVRAERPTLSLKIAGVGDGRWLRSFERLPGIKMLGKVDDIQPLYESCALSIAPLFQGSGTRVKIIEAARYARPVLTTAIGAEGLGLVPDVSYFNAENEAQWVQALVTMTGDRCQIVGTGAFRSLRDRFDGSVIAERFASQLK